MAWYLVVAATSNVFKRSHARGDDHPAERQHQSVSITPSLQHHYSITITNHICQWPPDHFIRVASIDVRSKHRSIALMNFSSSIVILLDLVGTLLHPIFSRVRIHQTFSR